MKLFKCVVSVTSIFLSMNLFAMTNASHCPPITSIKNAHIIAAENSGEHIWTVISENINHGGQVWNLKFAINLVGVDTTIQAKTAGENMLQITDMNKPQISRILGTTICFYANGNAVHSFIAAYNPPLHLS